MIADNLLTAVINEKQMIPIVIDAGLIRPPKSGFDVVAGRSVSSLLKLPEAQVIFILENIPFHSKTRMKFLLQQMDLFSDAHYIIIDRADVNIKRESDFLVQTPSLTFDVCEISFGQISHFVQKNFAMTASQSEVIALRLRAIFNRFDLSAHPSYFAGIPIDTLTALLEANRRSELIQLAVDGFLTLVVADDKARVALSRTTRSRFLRRLVVALKLEGRTLSQGEVIGFTEDFAKQYDFDINAIAFIQTFIDKGLVHFHNNEVRVSLPFIESYLLASELSANETHAIKYFQIDDPDFDLETFDLYSEIGPSQQLVSNVQSSLQSVLDDLSEDAEDEHVLLGGQIKPTILAKPDRLRQVRKGLAKMLKDIQDNKGKKEEKQRMLDLADQIKTSAAKQSRPLFELGPAGADEDGAKIEKALRTWVVGTVLLGSGAEHLDASTKRQLAVQLVWLASRIVGHWTQIRTKIDFAEIKIDLTTDESLESFAEHVGSVGDKEETKSFISRMVDVLELTILSDPLRKTLQLLSEQARHRVLAKSVAAAEVDGKLEKLIHAAWLADIDSDKGKKALKVAVANLPKAQFLRICLATHFMQRVYWSHWKPADRLNLLDAAESLLKPMNIPIDKPKLKRLIEHDKDQAKGSKSET